MSRNIIFVKDTRLKTPKEFERSVYLKKYMYYKRKKGKAILVTCCEGP
jgi:hypothetical protein